MIIALKNKGEYNRLYSDRITRIYGFIRTSTLSDELKVN